MSAHGNNNVNTDYFFGGIFRISLLFIILAELFSLSWYFWSEFNNIAFFVLAGVALILSLKKLDYGIYIVLAELFIGSKGYLFFFEHGGFVISIRIALWLIVMAVWFGKVINKGAKLPIGSLAPFRSSYFSYFLILFLFIIWGVINGFFNHNEFSNIFFDFNNWLYFLLVFPVYAVVGTRRGAFLQNTMQIFTAAIIWLCVKTFILLFIFSHFPMEFVWDIYRWVRVSGVGEITNAGAGFYRIFFQSHIFVLIGFFVFFSLVIKQTKIARLLPLLGKEGQGEVSWQTAGMPKNISSVRHLIPPHPSPCQGEGATRQIYLFYFLLLTSLLSVIIITFSRSFWVGLAFGLFTVYCLLFTYKVPYRKILKFSGILTACAIAAFTLIFTIVKFPYPSSTAHFSASLLSERASDISEGAAVSSRWNLLPELWEEIEKAPILGKGFGATVTYISGDPRILEVNPSGEYTTYAFEWGWLDIWLKIGLFGVMAYLFLLGKVIYGGVELGIRNWELGYLENKIILGLTIGLAVMAVVSIFSPYMNHPLGIGYLIFASAVLENYRQK